MVSGLRDPLGVRSPNSPRSCFGGSLYHARLIFRPVLWSPGPSPGLGAHVFPGPSRFPRENSGVLGPLAGPCLASPSLPSLGSRGGPLRAQGFPWGSGAPVLCFPRGSHGFPEAPLLDPLAGGSSLVYGGGKATRVNSPGSSLTQSSPR